MQSKGFLAAPKRFALRMLTCLVSQSQTLEAITITENKGRTEPPRNPRRNLLWCLRRPTRRDLFNLINFPQFKLMRETVPENF